MMTNEQVRAEFEAWAARIGLCVTGKYAETINGLCAESAFKAGYKAALQSRDKEDAERYRRLRKGDIDDVAVVQGLGAMDYGASAVIATYSVEIDGDDLDAAIDHARRIEGES